MQVAQWAEVGGMGVPGVDGGIAIGHSGPVHLHEAGPRFEKAAGQEQTLSEGVTAVLVTQAVLFFGQVEGISGATAAHEVEGLLIITI